MFIDYIKINISWIKDSLEIIFYFITALIVVLTYKRAKETILQPIRSEVIKKQTDLLIKLLDLIKDDYIDYSNIVKVNVFMWLSIYGFRVKDHDNLAKNMNTQMSGFIIVGDCSNEFELIAPFQKKDKEGVHENYNKSRYLKAKSGDININQIFTTKKLNLYLQTLKEIKKSPFLPYSVKEKLEKYLKDIHKNLTVHLREVLKEFIKDLFEKFDNKEFDLISNAGVYNNFNHRKTDHRVNFNDLYSSIRVYLKIDNMP
jgi:hypothetical protein